MRIAVPALVATGGTIHEKRAQTLYNTIIFLIVDLVERSDPWKIKPL